MDSDCADTFAWYKKVCLQLQHHTNVDDYECPDFRPDLSKPTMSELGNPQASIDGQPVDIQHQYGTLRKNGCGLCYSS